MMDKNESVTEYELHDGLFGQTDRNSGEYRFKSGNTQQIYSNASYMPVDDSPEPPRYYKSTRKERPEKEKKPDKAKRGLAMILALCLLCAIAGGAAGALLMFGLYSKNSPDIKSQIPDPDTVSYNFAENSIPAKNASAEVAESVLSANDIYTLGCQQVVSVNTERYTTAKDGTQIPANISGTGFFVSENGYILTNYHVVEEAYIRGYPVTVSQNDGTQLSASVVGVDNINDIALLFVNTNGCNCVRFGDSSRIEVGDEIFIIGNPYGVLDFTFTSGRIGGPIRQVDSSDSGTPVEMFQLDADIFDGNSGGPVYNSKGEVIGIVTAKFTDNSTEGIGFAIPVNKAAEIANNLISNPIVPAKASLGVDFFEKYNSVMANFYGLPAGGYVMSVRPGSCAEKAGIVRGDIIVQIGNTAVYDKFGCEEAISQYKGGDTVSIVVYRDSSAEYEYMTITFDEAHS